jgi:Zn-dependent M28 family amino/carboxypeptidase
MRNKRVGAFMLAKRFPGLLLLAEVLFLCLVAAPSLTAEPANAGIDARRLSEYIRILASDDFEGRGPGTRGEDKTLAYLTDQFEKLGLQPAGERGSWTQTVPLRRIETKGEIKVSFTLAGRARPLAELDEIVVLTHTPTNRVTVRNAPLVFVGFGVHAPERAWDDFKGYDLKGKIAVMLVNDPDFEMDPTQPLYGRFDGKAMTYYGRWTYKFEEAGRRGALGVLLVHETGPAGYGWNTVRNSDSVAQFDIADRRPSVPSPLVEGWIQRDIAVELFKAAGLNFDAEKQRAQTLAFRPILLRNTSFSADFAVDSSTIVSHNIVGKLTGTRYPEEAVLYSAHWDHLGIGAPDARGDRIYNGAVDNASGTAAMLEMARLFASSARTPRSIYFIGFTAEEKGLLGSRYYAEHPIVPLATTVALLNFDVINLKGPAKDVSSDGDGGSNLDALLAAQAAKQGRRFAPDEHSEEGRFFRGDHFSLAKAGVPAVTLAGGMDLLNGGIAAGQAWAQDYLAHRYHQPADEWRADWDYRGAEVDLAAYYNLGRELAESRDWPSWRGGAEFKAVRDATASARR